jgi:Thiamine monophosphate kinase
LLSRGCPDALSGGYLLLEEATSRYGESLPEEARKETSFPPRCAAPSSPPPPISPSGLRRPRPGAHALMDVSDGLVLDATRMAEASGVRIDFDTDAVIDEAWLMGGEDHGFLATFSSSQSLPEGFDAVGRVVENQDHQSVTVGGQPPEVERGGWDPYRDSK